MNVLLPVAFLLVPLTHWFLFKTKLGLRVLACGEKPEAAQAVGIDVAKYRYAMVVISGVLAAVGGAYLSIGDLSQFTTNMTAGRGFIALAAVIFGNWMPWRTMWSGAPVRVRAGIAVPRAGARSPHSAGSDHRPALSPDADRDHRAFPAIDPTSWSGTTPDRWVTGDGLSAIGYRLSAYARSDRLTTDSTHRLTDSPTPTKYTNPARGPGSCGEGEGGACAALHGLWERASLSSGAMLSAWLTSGWCARIHQSVARVINLTCFPAAHSTREGRRLWARP